MSEDNAIDQSAPQFASTPPERMRTTQPRPPMSNRSNSNPGVRPVVRKISIGDINPNIVNSGSNPASPTSSSSSATGAMSNSSLSPNGPSPNNSSANLRATANSPPDIGTPEVQTRPAAKSGGTQWGVVKPLARRETPSSLQAGTHNNPYYNNASNASTNNASGMSSSPDERLPHSLSGFLNGASSQSPRSSDPRHTSNNNSASDSSSGVSPLSPREPKELPSKPTPSTPGRDSAKANTHTVNFINQHVGSPSSDRHRSDSSKPQSSELQKSGGHSSGSEVNSPARAPRGLRRERTTGDTASSSAITFHLKKPGSAGNSLNSSGAVQNDSGLPDSEDGVDSDRLLHSKSMHSSAGSEPRWMERKSGNDNLATSSDLLGSSQPNTRENGSTSRENSLILDSSSFVDGKDLQEKFVKLCQVLKDEKRNFESKREECEKLKESLFNVELMLSLENEKSTLLSKDLEEQRERNVMIMQMGGGGGAGGSDQSAAVVEKYKRAVSLLQHEKKTSDEQIAKLQAQLEKYQSQSVLGTDSPQRGTSSSDMRKERSREGSGSAGATPDGLPKRLEGSERSISFSTKKSASERRERKISGSQHDELEHLRTENRNLKESLVQLMQGQQADFQPSIEQAENITKLETQLQEATKKLAQYKKEIKKLKSAREAQKVKTQQVIDAVKEERVKHEDEVRLLYAERDEMEQRFEELEAQLLETIQRIQTSRENERGASKPGAGVSESDLEDLEEELIEKEMQVVELERTVEQQEAQLAEKDKLLTSKLLEVENMEMEAQKKGREIRTLETELKATVEKLEKLFTITKTLRAENANLHAGKSSASGGTEDLEKALERVELLENTLRKLKGICLDQKEEFTEKIRILEQRNKTLQEKLIEMSANDREPPPIRSPRGDDGDMMRPPAPRGPPKGPRGGPSKKLEKAPYREKTDYKTPVRKPRATQAVDMGDIIGAIAQGQFKLKKVEAKQPQQAENKPAETSADALSVMARVLHNEKRNRELRKSVRLNSLRDTDGKPKVSLDDLLSGFQEQEDDLDLEGKEG